MISSGAKKNEIIFRVDKGVLMSYWYDLLFVYFNDYVYNSMCDFTHKDSGAGVRFNEVSKGIFFVHMYPPQK